MTVSLRRYDRSRFYAFDENLEDFDVLESPFVEDLRKLKSLGTIVVTESQKNSLDLIALNLYGDDELWWILAEFNQLDSPFGLMPGDELRYPDKSDIEELLFEHAATLNVFTK